MPSTRGARRVPCHVLERDQIPRHLATKISPHEVDLREVLALAELRGTLPLEMVAIGLQPAAVELSSEMSDTVRLRLPDLLEVITQRLALWDHTCRPRSDTPISQHAARAAAHSP